MYRVKHFWVPLPSITQDDLDMVVFPVIVNVATRKVN